LAAQITPPITPDAADADVRPLRPRYFAEQAADDTPPPYAIRHEASRHIGFRQLSPGRAASRFRRQAEGSAEGCASFSPDEEMPFFSRHTSRQRRQPAIGFLD